MFGVLILVSCFAFLSRGSLWSSKSASKYIPQPRYGKIITRNRFGALCSSMIFSQYSENETGDSRWSLVNGFFKGINRHRRAHVTPSHTVCVDEGMSRWYGLTGDWISKGLSHYVVMERKSENGCEIKTACCGVSGILLSMELVLSSYAARNRKYDGNLPHETSVLFRLTEPWFETGGLVCADSEIVSVTTARELFRHGLRFTGVVKTARK